MTAVCRTFNQGCFVILGLTALLLLAGIIVLPALDPTYADPAQTQTPDDSSAVRQPAGHGSRNQTTTPQESTEFLTSRRPYEVNAAAN